MCTITTFTQTTITVQALSGKQHMKLGLLLPICLMLVIERVSYIFAIFKFIIIHTDLFCALCIKYFCLPWILWLRKKTNVVVSFILLDLHYHINISYFLCFFFNRNLSTYSCCVKMSHTSSNRGCKIFSEERVVVGAVATTQQTT